VNVSAGLELEITESKPVTLSLGVAIFPDQAANSEELVKAGDVAQYEAKRAGRSRVVVSRADYGRP